MSTPVATKLSFQLSRTILKTMLPPIPAAKQWATHFTPTLTTPLLDLSQGVPGTPPPRELLDAISHVAADPSLCGYGPVPGEAGMREGVAQEMRVVYSPSPSSSGIKVVDGEEWGGEVDVKAEDVILTSGCNMAFIAVILALASAGDQVILPVPWYFNHHMDLDMLGITVVPLTTHSERGFVPDPLECEKLITAKTRAIALVSPNNPTGAIYPPSTLLQFATLAQSRGIALILDETYRDFIISHSPPHTLFTNTAEWEWRKTLIHLFSFSKSYCIPSHRLGAIVSDPEFGGYVRTVLDCLQVCPPRPAQIALPPLLPSLRPFISTAAHRIAALQSLFASSLPPNWKVVSSGAYYAWVRHPFPSLSSEVVSRVLAERCGIITLPSTFFAMKGGEGLSEEGKECMRFSVANVDEGKVRMVGERLGEMSGVIESGVKELLAKYASS